MLISEKHETQSTLSVHLLDRHGFFVSCPQKFHADISVAANPTNNTRRARSQSFTKHRIFRIPAEIPNGVPLGVPGS